MAEDRRASLRKVREDQARAAATRGPEDFPPPLDPEIVASLKAMKRPFA